MRCRVERRLFSATGVTGEKFCLPESVISGELGVGERNDRSQISMRKTVRSL
jgi:hypothetical protein